VRLTRWTRLAGILAVMACTIGCDRITKELAARHLAGRPQASFASDLFRLQYLENRGGFLSLGANLPAGARTAIFVVGTAALLGWVGVLLVRRVQSGRSALAPALLWAGGIANLADRVARGSVIDFMNVGIGPVRTGIFNVADVAITVGVVLLASEYLTHQRRT
jgi:signal peptidase II